MDVSAILKSFVSDTQAAFGNNLTGIYLHGSLAMGCFHENKSDIDLLVVVEQPLSTDIKRGYVKKILSLNRHAPKKGIEMSVVLKKDMNPFCHPAPFEMHFSNAHLESYMSDPDDAIMRLTGTDRDLAAHVTIINHYGQTLFGEDKEKVFSKVKHEDYLDALLYDLENAREDISEDPMYVAFSLCRVLAYVKEQKVLSKKDGAVWALKNVKSDMHPVIKEALNSYETDSDMLITPEDARRFADEMLSDIRTCMLRK